MKKNNLVFSLRKAHPHITQKHAALVCFNKISLITPFIVTGLFFTFVSLLHARGGNLCDLVPLYFENS